MGIKLLSKSGEAQSASPFGEITFLFYFGTAELP
jgi:hypothetical protein